MSEIGGLLRDTAERLFAAHCDSRALDAAEAGTWPAALWQAVEAAGFTKALLPEEQGGSGLEPVDALALPRLAAGFSAPIPLAETMLAQHLLAAAGLEPPAGPLALLPANPRDRLALARSGGGWRLSGVAARVPWARHATALVAVAAEGNRSLAVMLAPSEARIADGANLAGEPRDEVTLAAALPEDAAAPLPDGVDLGHVLALGAAMRAIQIAGALERTLEITVRYAGERAQFGRPIGKFQAVQQNLAVLATQAAAAGAAADLAAAAFSRQDGLLAIASAKARAGEAAGLGAALAHQLHGAIGFTAEYALQQSTRRLWSWREEFGNETEWSALLGRHGAAAGPERLWEAIAAI